MPWLDLLGGLFILALCIPSVAYAVLWAAFFLVARHDR